MVGAALAEFNRIFEVGRDGPSVRETVANIKKIADEQPYYKYNGIWNRIMEALSFCVVLSRWFGDDGTKEGRLLTYHEVADLIGGTTPVST
jgi:Translin family